MLMRVLGFENWDASVVSQIQDVSNSGNTGSRGTANSRWGYGAYLILTKNQWAEWRLKKPGGLFFQPSLIYTGFAFRIGTLAFTGQASGYRLVAYWYAQTGGAGHTQVSLVVRNDGTLELRRDYASNSPDISTSLGTSARSTNAISPNTWYYVECKVQVATSTTTTCEVRVNGSTWISIPVGANTVAQSGFAYADSFGFGDENTSTLDDQKWYDDVYLCDGTGSANNGYLGDCRVETVYPNAAGVSAQWSPVGNPSNYTDVNEQPSNGDVNYVTTTGIGNRDSYQMQDLSQTPNAVYGVQAWGLARVDAGETTRKINFALRSASTLYDSADQWTLTGSYAYYRSIWETDPATSAAFTAASVNALEAGVKLVS